MPPSKSEASRWFTEEVHPHGAQLRSYLRGSFPTVRDVDDVVQESYLRVWKARATRPIQSAKAFLFKVAQHVALDLVRRDRVAPINSVPDLADVPVLAEGPDIAESACTSEEITLLAEALDSLAPRCREIIMLRKFQHLSQKEVAERLGISEGTVQEQVYRGLCRCEIFLLKRGVVRVWHHD